MLAIGLKMDERLVETLDDGAALSLPGDLPDFWACPTLSQFAFDPVEVLDLSQDPTAPAGVVSAFEGFMKFTSNMGPAGCALHRGGMLFDEGLVALVTVALEGTLIVVRHDFFEALMASSLVPMITDSALFAGNFDDPEVALSGLSVPGVKILQWGFVNLEIGTFQEFLVDGPGNGLEVEGDLLNPPGEGLARKIDVVALALNLLLAVERKVVAILGNDDLGEQARGWESALDEAGWQGGNHGRLVLFLPVAFDEFGANESFL